jgi:hypothetical protein
MWLAIVFGAVIPVCSGSSFIISVEWRPLFFQTLPSSICVNGACGVQTNMNKKAHSVSFEWAVDTRSSSPQDLVVYVPDHHHKFSLSVDPSVFDCYIVSQQWDPRRSLGEITGDIEDGCKFMVDPPWVSMVERVFWTFEDFFISTKILLRSHSSILSIGIAVLVALFGVACMLRSRLILRKKPAAQEATVTAQQPKRIGALRVAYKEKKATYQHVYNDAASGKIVSEPNILNALSSNPDMSSVRVAYTS